MRMQIEKREKRGVVGLSVGMQNKEMCVGGTDEHCSRTAPSSRRRHRRPFFPPPLSDQQLQPTINQSNQRGLRRHFAHDAGGAAFHHLLRINRHLHRRAGGCVSSCALHFVCVLYVGGWTPSCLVLFFPLLDPSILLSTSLQCITITSHSTFHQTNCTRSGGDLGAADRARDAKGGGVPEVFDQAPQQGAMEQGGERDCCCCCCLTAWLVETGGAGRVFPSSANHHRFACLLLTPTTKNNQQHNTETLPPVVVLKQATARHAAGGGAQADRGGGGDEPAHGRLLAQRRGCVRPSSSFVFLFGKGWFVCL